MKLSSLRVYTAAVFVAVALANPHPAAGQAKDVAQGWSALAAGNTAQASTIAERALATHPRSAGALALAIEAAIARAGSPSALRSYEQWLGTRTFEEPLVVRRIAFSALKEYAAQKENALVRLEALRGLAADEDAEAFAELQRMANAGGSAEARALAEQGDQRAVKLLVEDLQKGTGNAVLLLDSIGQSGDQAAVSAVMAKLSDPRSEVRGAAIQALGRLGGTASADRLHKIMNDPNEGLFVKLRAAGALFRMGDDRGRALLDDTLSEAPSDAKVMALEALAVRPDAAFRAHAEKMAALPEPHLRAAAAQIIAPHHPDLAEKMLDPLASDPNPVVREMATQAVIEGSRDLSALRKLLNHQEAMPRARAARRILVLTR